MACNRGLFSRQVHQRSSSHLIPSRRLSSTSPVRSSTLTKLPQHHHAPSSAKGKSTSTAALREPVQNNCGRVLELPVMQVAHVLKVYNRHYTFLMSQSWLAILKLRAEDLGFHICECCWFTKCWIDCCRTMQGCVATCRSLEEIRLSHSFLILKAKFLNRRSKF